MTTLNFLMYKIIGRNFEYDEALKIVQFEEYTEDIDFDEIKRYDIQKRIGNFNQKLDTRKGRNRVLNSKHGGKYSRKHPGKNSGKKYGKIPEKILQKIEENKRNKKRKVRIRSLE